MPTTAYQRLGGEAGREDTTVYQALEVIRDGLPVIFFERGAELLGVSRQDYASLIGLSLSQIQRAKKRNIRLSSTASERILMISNLVILSDNYFGDPEKRDRWLHRPNLNLGNSTPLSVCDTTMGIRLVSDIITRMTHGFSA
jgi:putative toxin-antitoxin system antitoxin component (TIGR02293 family)